MCRTIRKLMNPSSLVHRWRHPIQTTNATGTRRSMTASTCPARVQVGSLSSVVGAGACVGGASGRAGSMTGAAMPVATTGLRADLSVQCAGMSTTLHLPSKARSAFRAQKRGNRRSRNAKICEPDPVRTSRLPGPAQLRGCSLFPSIRERVPEVRRPQELGDGVEPVPIARDGRGHYFAEAQLAPKPVSTVRGTRSTATCSITSRTRASMSPPLPRAPRAPARRAR